MRRVMGVLAATAILCSSCGSGEGSDSQPDEDANTELGRVGSVIELRDAAVDAGYVCSDWQQDNMVGLAAESGSCDETSVLSTYASDADLQAQLDTEKAIRDLLADSDIPGTPVLVGENWLFKDPDAAAYVSVLGGTLIGPKG